MLRVALIAAAVAVAVSTAAVERALPEAAAGCPPDPSSSMACGLRTAEPDGAVSAAELADLGVPAAPVFDWTPRHPSLDPDPDFKDAAAEPGSVLPASLDREHPQPVIPALLALGALVLLLRRRPT